MAPTRPNATQNQSQRLHESSSSSPSACLVFFGFFGVTGGCAGLSASAPAAHSGSDAPAKAFGHLSSG